MKFSFYLVFILGVMPIFSSANEYITQVKGIQVNYEDSSNLSIQNLSSEEVKIGIFGNYFVLKSASGLKFECAGYENIEIQIISYDYKFFEVPCNSKVIFSESFNNEMVVGE